MHIQGFSILKNVLINLKFLSSLFRSTKLKLEQVLKFTQDHKMWVNY